MKNNGLNRFGFLYMVFNKKLIDPRNSVSSVYDPNWSNVIVVYSGWKWVVEDEETWLFGLIYPRLQNQAFENRQFPLFHPFFHKNLRIKAICYFFFSNVRLIKVYFTLIIDDR